MKGSLHGEDFILVPFHLLFRIFPGKLYGPFIRLRTAVTEKDLLCKGMLAQEGSQFNLGLNIIEIRNMDQFLCLVLNGLDHVGVAMPEEVRSEPRSEVQIVVPVDVLDGQARGALDDEGIGSGVRVGHDFRIAFNPRASVWSGA